MMTFTIGWLAGIASMILFAFLLPEQDCNDPRCPLCNEESSE